VLVLLDDPQLKQFIHTTEVAHNDCVLVVSEVDGIRKFHVTAVLVEQYMAVCAIHNVQVEV
jgi:hypothetical protein